MWFPFEEDVLVNLQSANNLVVPIKWVQKLNLAECGNGGINSDVMVTIFYSPDKSKDANFSLLIQNVFDEHADACFLARANKFYGECQHIFSNISFAALYSSVFLSRHRSTVFFLNTWREWSHFGAGQKKSNPAKSILRSKKITSKKDQCVQWARARRRTNGAIRGRRRR